VASSGVVIALPPYLTTTVCPFRDEMEDAMVMAFSANGDEEEKIAEDNVLRDTTGDVGANASDVQAKDDARKMALAEQNSFMVSMVKRR
jgi:hypothetical protein